MSYPTFLEKIPLRNLQKIRWILSALILFTILAIVSITIYYRVLLASNKTIDHQVQLSASKITSLYKDVSATEELLELYFNLPRVMNDKVFSKKILDEVGGLSIEMNFPRVDYQVIASRHYKLGDSDVTMSTIRFSGVLQHSQVLLDFVNQMLLRSHYSNEIRGCEINRTKAQGGVRNEIGIIYSCDISWYALLEGS